MRNRPVLKKIAERRFILETLDLARTFNLALFPACRECQAGTTITVKELMELILSARGEIVREELWARNSLSTIAIEYAPSSSTLSQDWSGSIIIRRSTRRESRSVEWGRGKEERGKMNAIQNFEKRIRTLNR
jgi:hypothetical protein